MADTLNLPSLKSRQGVDRNANVAILSGRKAHLDKLPGPTADSSVGLSAKTAVPDFRAVLGNNLSVEPGRTIAGNLPVATGQVLSEILTVITCHGATIDIGKSRRKSC